MKTFVFTITLYNQYKKDGKTFWGRTVLKNCYFGTEGNEKLMGATLTTNDDFVCRVPKNKAYMENYGGEAGKFSLNKGDIVVNGEVFDEISDESGKRVSDLLGKYKGKAFTIKSFSDNTVLHHFPHYRVRGV